MRIRLFTVLLLATALMVLGVSAVVAGAKTSIVYWTHSFDPAIKINDELIEKFTKENPDIEIIYDHAPHANYEQKLLTAFAGGAGPDAYWAGDWMMPQFIPANMVAPVDADAFRAYKVNSTEEFIRLYDPGALTAFIEGGKVYTGGISEYNTFSLFYNEDHFKEAGLTTPSKKDPMTWEEFAVVGTKLTRFDAAGNRTRSAIEFVYKVPIWTVLLFEPMVRQLGGELVDPRGGPNFNSSAVLKTMQYVRDLRYKHKVLDPAFVIGHAEDIAKGRMSMMIAGPWFVPPVKNFNPNINLKVAPLPVFFGGKRVTTLYAWAWYVNPKSKVKRDAWKLLAHLTSFPDLWWDRAGYIQPKVGTHKHRLETQPLLDVFIEDFKYAQYEFRSPHYFEVSDAFTRGFQKILEGEEPAMALSTIQDEARRAIGR
jgi:ABC-type glycerol-3-phosphate transport system substrate-binding protein